MRRSLAVIIAAVLGLAADFYNEPYRPQFHFSPQRNWTNDPCGIVYANGEYHLFFQFNPMGDLWGHMSWGHAVSPDLLHWRELPVAIAEDAGAMIFTGSSVVDRGNTSGLCSPGTSCIVSIYTGHTAKTEGRSQRQAQNLAASQDGRTWVKYKGNPVLDIGLPDFRDPKVFWRQASREWIMVVALPRDRKVSIYRSADLRNWKHASDFGPAGATGGDWECPDLFELPVDGDSRNMRWVLKIGLNPGHIAGGSGEQYFIGRFDGAQFRNDNPASEIRWLDHGRDCYCALTFNGEPDGPSRHMIGWMNNWLYARAVPTTPWRGAMTLPRTLELRSSATGPRLVQAPVPETHSLRAGEFSFRGTSTAELNRRLASWAHRAQTYEIEALIRPRSATRITWRLREGAGEYTLAGFDAAARQIFVDRTRSGKTGFSESYPSRTVAPLDAGTAPLALRIFVDRSSIEVFGGGGRAVLTNLIFPKPESTGISITAEGGEPDLDVRIWSLRSTWKP